MKALTGRWRVNVDSVSAQRSSPTTIGCQLVPGPENKSPAEGLRKALLAHNHITHWTGGWLVALLTTSELSHQALVGNANIKLVMADRFIASRRD
jgi:hypothetical protein